jgi:hypothetical protein
LPTELSAQSDEMTEQGWTTSRWFYDTVWTIAECKETHMNSEWESKLSGIWWMSLSSAIREWYSPQSEWLSTKSCRVLVASLRVMVATVRIPLQHSFSDISYSDEYFLRLTPVIRSSCFREFIVVLLFPFPSSFTFLACPLPTSPQSPH